MARVLGKTSLVPSVSCNNHHRHHNQRGQISLSPRGASGYGTKSLPRLKIKSQALKTHFYGKQLVLRDDEGSPTSRRRWASRNICKSQMGLIGKPKWWEKGVKPNMREVESAQDLASFLSNAGDQLVVVHFYSPGCGGCRALHPKICQLAEMNPEVQFLHVNYEEHKSMCYSLNVHVLPFFRFYRGAHGRLCSFSCTNATIKKFKDALAKHGPERCSIGPTKGLEERELQALAGNKDLNFSYTSTKQAPKQAPKPAFSSAQDERLIRGLSLILEPKEAEKNILVAGRR